MSIRGSFQIGHVIRDAMAFNIQNWPGDKMNLDSLLQAVQDIFDILEQRSIDYVLVGGVALLHYVEGRNTQDLDLMMALSSLEKLPELKITSRDANFVRANYKDLQIDILLTENPLYQKVHRSYSSIQQISRGNISIATVEGLLLLKLYALPSLYRQGNFARVGIYENDIATLLHYYPSNTEKLLSELSGHMDENDLSEIKNILLEIQNRLKRFDEDFHESASIAG